MYFCKVDLAAIVFEISSVHSEEFAIKINPSLNHFTKW